ncbi:MAG: hypothetical protein Q9166_000048 [cf. Caloplaca sp. 2 TL-2023]
MAEIVYPAVIDGTGIQGSLFQGAKFWLSQKVPQRKRFVEEVKANGGEVTPLEKEADVKIVDHARKEQLPGTYSYRYIEDSVRNSALEDLEKHAVGPPVGTLRPVGSIIQPAKSARTKFTSEDDHALVTWVVGFEQRGGASSGNEIYKQLEAQNPRHTWQSWRDRWVKTLKHLPRSAFISQNAPPTPPADQGVENSVPPKVAEKQQTGRKPFTEEDAQELLSAGFDIENIDPDQKKQAWSAWATSHDNPEDHSADDWQDLWERSIRPIYLKQDGRRTEGTLTSQRAATAEEGLHDTPEGKEQVGLPVRVAPAKKDTKESTVSRSSSYHPESPTRQSQVSSPEPAPGIPAGDSTDGASDSRVAITSTAKRKRPTSKGDEEVPSSSPPQPVLPTKRTRHSSPSSEVALSPAKGSSRVLAREIPDNYPAERLGARDVIEIDDEEESLGEKINVSERTHSSSPELGSSPKKVSINPDPQLSKTQLAFQEPTPSVEYDLPAPEGGWPDEDGDERDDEEDDPQEAFYGNAEFNRIMEEEGRLGDGERPISISEASEVESSIDSADEELAREMETTISPAPARATLQPTTQALLATETQEPDFSLAEPEGGWDNVLPSSPPALPHSSQQHDGPQVDKQPSPPSSAVDPDKSDEVDQFVSDQLALGYDEDFVLLALQQTSMDTVVSKQVLEYMETHGAKVPDMMRGCWTESDDKKLRSIHAQDIMALEDKHGKGSLEQRWEFLDLYKRSEDKPAED